jgi:bifunctional enzyme CysN/CysC
MGELAREEINMVFAGHVDHGKSTIIGRLLADTNALPEGKLELVKENCRRNDKPFEYAFLLDALKEEQSQGVTIDIARCFFKTAKRDYIIIDAPGHVEFLKNLITGASWAETAALVIDAKEGVCENSRRHGFMLSMLGIHQIAVLVNKMDLVGYDQDVFSRIMMEYTEFLARIHVNPVAFIPVSGREGDNIAFPSTRMPWYTGKTVIQQFDAFQAGHLPQEKPFRLPIQDIYKFTGGGDHRRIVAGKIESGKVSVGDEIIICPTGRKASVETIEMFNATHPIRQQVAGWSAGLTFKEPIFVRRGEVIALAAQKRPCATDRIRVSLFWLGKQPLEPGKKYLFKINTDKVEMEMESILRVMDTSSLEQKQVDRIESKDVAECILRMDRAVVFDIYSEMPETGRFVIVDDYEISGGGIILEALESQNEWLDNKVQRRNIHWESPSISELERAERYNQKSCLILVTGSPENDLRKRVAKELERQLFHDGKFVYFIGMANLLYGITADIKNGKPDLDEVKVEYFRRLAELAHLMLDAGLILVVSAREIRSTDIKVLETVLLNRADRIFTVWVGDSITTDLQPDIHFSAEELAEGIQKIKQFLQNQGMIFNPA